MFTYSCVLECFGYTLIYDLGHWEGALDRAGARNSMNTSHDYLFTVVPG